MVSKLKKAFVCNECGSDYPKWQGQCTDCNAWNTLTEIKLSSVSGKITRHQGFSGSSDSSINLLKDVQLEEVPRIRSGTSELDLVLGGGFVPGSCVLLGGEPGAGKTTMVLTVASAVAKRKDAMCVFNTAEYFGNDFVLENTSRSRISDLKTS